MTKLVNRAKMTTATTGTGTITLGSAVDGYQTFAAAGVANADVVRYVIEDGTDWEIGTGTYTASGTTLSRTVNESSNAGAAISLSGDAVVFVTAAGADIQQPPSEGAFVDGDKTKLDGIESLADVTDTANVTAAGALMDSELTDIVSVKALDQGLATTDTPSFAGLTATTADINGGTIDGVTIGGASAGAGTFTTLTTTGNVTFGDAATDTVTFTADVASNLIPSADNTYDLGASGSEWRNLFIDGTANIDSLAADAATIAGNLTVNGNTTLGNAATDTVTITADVASNIIPSADNTYDLGASGSEWRNLFIDGTANIDSLVANTADINGGTIDGVTIGTNSAVTEAQIDNININGNAITSTNTDGNIALTPNGTGEVDISKVDIDGGAIDNTVIGGTTPAAVTASALTVGTATYPTSGPLSNRNKIINGAMVIDQRNAGAAVTPTATAYTIDRWQYQTNVASKITIQQNAGSVTPPVGFSNYLGFTTASAHTAASGNLFEVTYKVEGFDFVDLMWGSANAQPVTLSFWAYSSIAGTHSGSFSNGASTRSYPFTFSISTTNTWEYKTITVAGDTSGTWDGGTNGVGVFLYFDFGSGSTFRGTAGAWAAANLVGATGATSIVGSSGATFYITGVQLEAGDTATPFEHRSYGQELALCQRYYFKTNSSVRVRSAGYSANARSYGQSITLPVTMRASPTITLSSISFAGSNTAAVELSRPDIWVFSAINASDGSNSTTFNFDASAEL